MSFTDDDDPNRGHRASNHPGHDANNRGDSTGDTDDTNTACRRARGIRTQTLAEPLPPAEPERKPEAVPHRPPAAAHRPELAEPPLPAVPGMGYRC